MPTDRKPPPQFIGLRSATALVVANIIGAGIFTTTGFQAADLGHPGWIFLLWIVGGVLAMCGALCYAELAAAMPEAGAEYVYLRETYGELLGFMSAFVSLVAGFSAPIATAAKGFIIYVAYFVPVLAEDPKGTAAMNAADVAAVSVVWLLVAVHLRGARGVDFSDLITLAKVAGIVAIVVAAFAVGRGSLANLTAVSPGYEELTVADKVSALATSLIFVSFCYLGFNASAYVAAEMRNPQRDLPRSLLAGTSVVIVLYLALNAFYFYGAGVDALAGEPDVGAVAAEHVFGTTGVQLVSIVAATSILASASAMTIAGPRVYYAMGRDMPLVGALAHTGARTGAPVVAIIVQGIVTTAIVLSGRIDQIMQYAGFTLALFSSLAVSCVLVLRVQRPDMPRPFRAWGYPFTPLLFLSVTVWTMIWAVRGRPVESSLALATVAVAGACFFVASRFAPANSRD